MANKATHIDASTYAPARKRQVYPRSAVRNRDRTVVAIGR